MNYNFLKRYSLGSVLLALVSSVLPGCSGDGNGPSGPTGTAKGQVLYQGQPVGEGTVSLVNSKLGVGGTAELEPDGTFEISKPLLVGEYAVSIHPPLEAAPNDGVTSPAMIEKDVSNIPPQFRTEQTSELKAVVKEDENEFKFELQ
jgi:hypothetical protein